MASREGPGDTCYRRVESRCRDRERLSRGPFTDGSRSWGPAEAESRLTSACEYVATYLGSRK